MQDLHTLPKVRDSMSYLYVERCRVDQDGKAIAIHDARGSVAVPCASLTLLMLGPGTTITHAAMRTLAANGCLVQWVGEAGVRFYAQGMGETRSARNLLRQAFLASDPGSRMDVVRRMYAMRFAEALDPGLSLRQIRGYEGRRVRTAYAEASETTGVPWQGRNYSRSDWGAADPINRALSVANACLYGICQSAIISAGYSPGLGFIHHGDMRSFVFDIADLYKTEITIPVAFRVVAREGRALESQIRAECRNRFYETRLLGRIVRDIGAVLGTDEDDPVSLELDGPVGIPGWLWDPDEGQVEGGQNYADPAEGEAPLEEEG